MSLFPDLMLSRRRLARTAVAGAAAVPVVALARPGAATAGAATAGAPTPGLVEREAGETDEYRLHRTAGSVVAALDLPVNAVPGLSRSRGATRTPVIRASRFSMMGMTWTSGSGIVRARFRAPDGSWSPWRRLSAYHDGPDADAEEARNTPRATELVWAGRSDAVQVETTGRLSGAVLALIDPGVRAEDKVDVDLDQQDRRTARAKGVPRPAMRTRKQWGANPSWTTGKVEMNSTIKQAHVHHTVSSNNYRRDDVPGMLRGMYRYHTHNLGWSDIGYNFLVDKFGRIWIGRRGGAGNAVRGAHTLGFNNTSFGVAVIGNFETAGTNNAIIGALSRLTAWKLHRYGRDPRGKISVVSTGSDRFPAGRRVWLPVIDGHRQTNETACPGRHLYADLPAVRRRSKRRINRFT